VNFPIKTVIVDAITRATERTGHRPLPFDEFWNIAGRAGRAMKDHVGLIIFAARNQGDIEVYKNYLQQDARNVVSSILEDLDKLTEIAEKFDRKFIGDYPALARFFQYLLHAITVADYETVSTEIEDVLRSSLVYHQVGAVSSESAKKLIQLARAYLGVIKEQSKNKGILQLVDGTGFSSVTVNFLWSQRDEFKDINIWNNEVLFSQQDTSLSRMIDVLAGIPELDLTRIGKGALGVEAIASIIKEWVAGVSIEQIADEYFAVKEDRDERILDASRYIHNKLVAQLAWGMSALQKVSLFGQKDVKWDEVGHIPALMYYGVSSKEAATLRMLGVPRKSAESLGRKYPKEVATLPTFQQMRNWLNSLPEKEWEDANKKSKLSGKEAKSVWQILNGIT
jgi:replicative superfamily II helicase